MSEATLSETGGGRWTLGGALDFSTVPDIWPSLERLLGAGGALRLSLAKVNQTNSAGLVLLVEARDLALRTGCRLDLVDLPPALMDLARMSGCETLIAPDAA